MIDKAEKMLASRNVNPTPTRVLVLSCLLKDARAQSLKDLEVTLYNSDRSSIFRTLKTFEEFKVVHSIEDGSGRVKYAVCEEGCNCDPEDLHYHFYCTNCSITYCLLDSPIPTVKLPANFKMSQANMVIKGLCDKCT